MVKRNKEERGEQGQEKEDNVFITISNGQIYRELCEFKEENRKEHQAIMNEIASYKSQVSNLKMAIGGIGVLLMTMLGFFINHIL